MYLGGRPACTRRDAVGTFSERAEQLGLFGCIEGGPADLSTNQDYMAGFGDG